MHSVYVRGLCVNAHSLRERLLCECTQSTWEAFVCVSWAHVWTHSVYENLVDPPTASQKALWWSWAAVSAPKYLVFCSVHACKFSKLLHCMALWWSWAAVFAAQYLVFYCADEKFKVFVVYTHKARAIDPEFHADLICYPAFGPTVRCCNKSWDTYTHLYIHLTCSS